MGSSRWSGNANGGISGGLGAYIKGEFNLTAGNRISILVGQQADGVSHGNSNAGGGGGGGTFVVLELETPLLIAGGGGGTGATMVSLMKIRTDNQEIMVGSLVKIQIYRKMVKVGFLVMMELVAVDFLLMVLTHKLLG